MKSYYTHEDCLYYCEFENGLCRVYRRHFFLPPLHADDHPLVSNEGHPYHIFTVDVPPHGCVPDESWYKWMIDKLNA